MDLQQILPILTILLFIGSIFWKGNSPKTCILFILYFLPLMNLKITPERLGGFKIFEVVCFYSVIFLFKDFQKIYVRQKNSIYFFLFAILASILLLGGITSEYPEKTLLSFVKFLPIFIFCRFFIIEHAKNNDFFFQGLKALKASYLFALGFIFIQVLVGLKFTIYSELSPNTIDETTRIIRYPGIFYDSQASGQYLSLGSFLFLIGRKFPITKIQIGNLLVFFAAIIAILFAGSRSAMGGYAVGILFALVFANGRLKFYAAVFTIFILSLFFILSIPLPKNLTRAENLSDDYLFRKSIWDKAYVIATEHPLLGIGTDNYQSYITKHSQDQYLELEDGSLLYFDQPENGYLKILVELGFIGFSIYIIFIITPLIRGILFYLKGVKDIGILFLIAAIISWLIAFNTVYSIIDNRILIMVVSILLLLLCYPNKQTKHIDELA